MSNILASFRIKYSDPQFDLAAAIKQVSIQLHKYTAAQDFATLFGGIIDPEAHTLKFVNAGHNPPLVVRQNGDSEFLEASGVMIGAFDFSDWQLAETKLNPGDVLFVFTDGVSEANDSKDNQYGEERIKDMIIKNRADQPEAIARKLFDDIMVFVENEPRADDITMLIVKRGN